MRPTRLARCLLLPVVLTVSSISALAVVRSEPAVQIQPLCAFFDLTTFWERYSWHVLVVAAVLLLQSLLLVTLASQRSKLRRSRNSLADRLRFERLISDLTTRFSEIDPGQAGQTMRDGVASLRALLAIDRASLLLFSDDRSTMLVNHTSVAPGIEPLPARISVDRFPKLIERLCRGESIAISRAADDTSIDAAERATLVASGVRSLFATPLQAGGETLGFLSLATLATNRTWSDSVIRRLQMFANLFANVVLRLRDAEARISSEALSHAVLNSVSALVAVVDGEGNVIAVNAAWERVARGTGRLARIRVGVNYLEECEKAAEAGDTFAREAAAGLKAVIDGTLPEFRLEHKAELDGVEHWYVKTVELLDRPEGGAIISHQDITERRRAEFEADERRKQLAHVARVSTMGELAASIAHELNQPLTGVLTNAQAAQRFMAADPPDLDEVRDILADIVEDDKRAGEVIRRLRGMLKAGSVERVPLDVNDLVRDVIKLVGSDAAMRSVRIELRATPDLPRVQGDWIQLQQVVLNLVINGMDAMKTTPEPDRRLVIATRLAGAERVVEIVVEDAGAGIEDEHLARLFRAFFTTKPDGMGIGLSIARTIIEAHEGTVSAANNDARGATFVVSLPALEEGDTAGRAEMKASAD